MKRSLDRENFLIKRMTEREVLVQSMKVEQLNTITETQRTLRLRLRLNHLLLKNNKKELKKNIKNNNGEFY